MQYLLRLTNDIRSGGCSPPPGSIKTQSGMRPLCVFIPPHFAVAGLASQALIRNRKTSYI